MTIFTRTIPIVALAVLFGCGGRAARLRQLSALADQDAFAPAAGDLHPMPAQAPAALLTWARANYDKEPEARRSLARYFLRYDAALISLGLVDADVGPNDLVGVFFEEESRLEPTFSETLSAPAMRRHIEHDATRFPAAMALRHRWGARRVPGAEPPH